MALPNPDRTIPNTDTVGPPGPSGGEFANKVAAEVQRIWDLVPNMLVNIGGSADAITAECDPPLISSYIHGQRFWLIPAANNTGPVTIDIDQRGQVDVVSYNGQQLQAGDLVAGEGTELVYDGGNNQMRLVHPTARALLARASGGASWWEKIGDSGVIGAPVAQIEFTFTANRYSNVMVLVSDLQVATNGQRILTISLRHAGGSIVSINSSAVADSLTSAQFVAKADFTLRQGSIGGNLGVASILFKTSGSGSFGFESRYGSGINANSPDRVRVELSSGNIGAGRVTAYGLRVEAD